MAEPAQAGINLVDNRLELSGLLDFSSVPVLVNEAVKLLSHADSIVTCVIDLSAVDRSNSAGVAMLLELGRLGMNLNKTMRIWNMPEHMEIIARAHGVEEPLMAMMMD